MSVQDKHPLSDRSEEKKIAYLFIVASMASADGTVSDEVRIPPQVGFFRTFGGGPHVQVAHAPKAL